MSVLELKMILSARSWTLSSLRLSEALQKCQTVWQYVKFGITTRTPDSGQVDESRNAVKNELKTSRV